MNPDEWSVSAHDLNVSVFKEDCLTRSDRPFVAPLGVVFQLVGFKSDTVEMLNVGKETVAV